MTDYLLIAQIVVAIALIAVLTLQVKGGGLGGIFGQPDSVYRTRRGVEKSLLQITIALTVLLVGICIWVVVIS
ncbi:MAG: preprotein translocase subunit SecG [Chloroflexi bacterium RBG_19FT_COMBO_48_23]|nr:MAG: preprotein translocase subunit SecG [Chloroflexi bacterium RBG_19FT_COMBO_48_23]